MSNMNIEEMKEKFQLYLFGIDDELVELNSLLAKITGKKKVLDETLESLNIVEDVFGDILDGKVEIDIEIDQFITRISSYMGEIVRKNRGGAWKLCLDEDNYDYTYPQIGGMKGFIDSFNWCPINVVYNYKAHRRKGLLKSATKYILDFDYANFK